MQHNLFWSRLIAENDAENRFTRSPIDMCNVCDRCATYQVKVGRYDAYNEAPTASGVRINGMFWFVAVFWV